MLSSVPAGDCCLDPFKDLPSGLLHNIGSRQAANGKATTEEQAVSDGPTSDPLIRINYGSGLTPTEELLTQLGERSFLRFWSHANPYVNRKEELCDLLVVCGDFVITFSDKNNEYRSTDDQLTGWRRWYKSAATKSVNQLNGATRNLLLHRVPIFKDKECTVPLGIPIPHSGRERHYRVAVVSRARSLNQREAFVPFIKIDSSVVGVAHTQDGAVPFVVGDVAPKQQFVHVMDVAGLRAVLTELDTVSDFAEYLDARESFIRGNPGNSADSEWSLLARFMLSYDDEGESLPMDRQAPGATQLTRAEWDNDQFRRDMANRREANAVSRVWDMLIEDQATMIEKQSFAFSTFRSVEGAERVVQYMALEHRLHRRILGKRWMEACQLDRPESPANLRTVPHSAKGWTTYVFLNVSNFLNESQEQYREKRRWLLRDMMLASLVDEPNSQIIIGIAAELGGPPDSYDLAFFDVVENEGEQLRKDARLAWEKKRQAFELPVRTRHDEWSIPRPK